MLELHASTAAAMASHRALVGDTLDLLYRVLRPYVEQEMRGEYGDDWERVARRILHNRPASTWDTSDLLAIIYERFRKVFFHLGHEGRSWVSLLREVRKTWAHQGELSLTDTRRTLETAILLLRAVGADAEADSLEPHMLELMQAELERKQHALPDAQPDGEASLLERSRLGLDRVRTLLRREPTEPLEIRRQVLDAVERAAAPHRQHFPYNRLTVHVLADSHRMRQLYEAAFTGLDESFDEAVHRQLAEARVPVAERLQVGWRFHRSAPERFADALAEEPAVVELTRRRVATTATLTVEKGLAERDDYTIRSKHTVTVGRLAEVVDARGRLVRRNTVAFADYERPDLPEDERKIVETVSRIHARIAFDEAAGAFRVHDDGSTWGTSVVREHLHVPIPVRQQPVALQDGDLIYFGKACVRFSAGRSRR